MPDSDKDKKKDEKKDKKKSTLQEKLDAIDEIKELAIKNISAKIMTDEPNNTYNRKPSKMRKIVGLKGFKGFKGSKPKGSFS